MLIVLPPSETKAPGGTDATMSLSFPSLDAVRTSLIDVLTATERRRLPDLARRGLTTGAHGDRVVLTRAGRLLADGVVRDLLD